MLLLQEHKIMVAEKLLTDQQENGAGCNRRDLEFLFRDILSAGVREFLRDFSSHFPDAARIQILFCHFIRMGQS